MLGMQDVKLAATFLAGLPPDVSRSLVVFFGKVDAALEASKQISNQVFALDDVPEEALTSPVLVIGASQEQVSTCASHNLPECAALRLRPEMLGRS